MGRVSLIAKHKPFIGKVCDELLITIPRITYIYGDTTLMGSCSWDKNHIQIARDIIDSDEDVRFTLAHELRHRWQMANGYLTTSGGNCVIWKNIISGYTSTHSYVRRNRYFPDLLYLETHARPEEIDADAYARYACAAHIG